MVRPALCMLRHIQGKRLQERSLPDFLIERADQLLYFRKKSGQVKSVRHRVMDVHGQGHEKTSPFQLIPAPGNHRGKKPALVKDVNVKMPIPHPREA